LIVAALFIGFTQVAPSRAASFDCARISPEQCPEAAICNDMKLGRLDTVMDSLFTTARSMMQQQLRTGFRDYQREWLAERNQCGCNKECLEDAYDQRINDLKGTIREIPRN
jgi:uncharacterized protein